MNFDAYIINKLEENGFLWIKSVVYEGRKYRYSFMRKLTADEESKILCPPKWGIGGHNFSITTDLEIDQEDGIWFITRAYHIPYFGPNDFRKPFDSLDEALEFGMEYLQRWMEWTTLRNV